MLRLPFCPLLGGTRDPRVLHWGTGRVFPKHSLPRFSILLIIIIFKSQNKVSSFGVLKAVEAEECLELPKWSLCNHRTSSDVKELLF